MGETDALTGTTAKLGISYEARTRFMGSQTLRRWTTAMRSRSSRGLMQIGVAALMYESAWPWLTRCFGRLSMLMETGMPIRVSSAVDLLLLSKRMDKTGVSLLSRTECKCSPTGQRHGGWQRCSVCTVM